MHHPLTRIACIFPLLFLISCQRYLDEKSDSNLLTPSTTEDLRRLLNNELLNLSPLAAHAGTDEYYLTPEQWEKASPFVRDAYTWQPQTQATGTAVADWAQLYNTVQYANTVLDHLNIVQEPLQYRYLKGAALFFRCFAFYQLLQVYSPAYTPQTAGSPYGIALRLRADFNEPSVRAGLGHCHRQIERDLIESAHCLQGLAVRGNQPGAAAPNALLAKLYLVTGNYAAAEKYADRTLALQPALLNYNNLPATGTYPPVTDHPELIFYATATRSAYTLLQLANADTLLRQSFEADDLRSRSYFQERSNGSYAFRGSYAAGNLFTGLATGEIYLIRAEARARQGRTIAALNDLNQLLASRFRTGAFIPVTATSPTEALLLILNERKKELLFRGTRWTDLRRLNEEPSFARTLTRMLNGRLYQLSPGDSRFTYLIPADVINLTGMPQNKR